MESGEETAVSWALAVDAVTAEVCAALEEAGVVSLLLKGPTIARWLYEEGSRSYTDTDLLVDPDRLDEARVVLRRLGFVPAFGTIPHPGMESPPSAPWVRGPFAVDLHETLPGAEVPRQQVWEVMRDGSVDLEVGGRRVRALGEAQRLAHVALHAAHHGPHTPQPMNDLVRALARVGHDTWIQAGETALAVGAAEAFWHGLALSDEGRSLTGRLGLDAPRAASRALMELDGVPVAAGLERLRRTHGVRPRVRLLAAEVLPAPEFMRWWSPLARRSRRGLIAAYVWRIFYLALRTPAGVRSWLRASAPR